MKKGSTANMLDGSTANKFWFFHAITSYMNGYEKDEVDEEPRQVADQKKTVTDRKSARRYNRRQMKKEKKWLRAQKAIHTNGHDAGNPYRLQKGQCGYYTKSHREERVNERRADNSLKEEVLDGIEMVETLKTE